MPTKYRTKFEYVITTGSAPSEDELMAVRASTKYRELRQKLNGLAVGSWLKLELTGEETDKGVDLVRQAVYNWSHSGFVELGKKGLRAQTLTVPSSNGSNDITMWVHLVEK